MINIEKKIAEKTLKILTKKTFNALSVQEILINKSKKKINIKSKVDLLKNINRYETFL